MTDPPFFDNVHYSQLADFFYYWLNQWLDLSSASSTRSKAEVQDTDASLFTSKLTSVFAECRRILRNDGLFVFTYHHARHDGWTAVHRAIRHAGFICTRSFPIKAEMAVSMPLQQAKSPIHLDLVLVCRKSVPNAMLQWETEPIREAIKRAAEQASQLTMSGIRVSLADAKVILMGQLLCETHRLQCLNEEESFLEHRERDVDSYVQEVIAEKGEVLYETPASQQLVLFEQMAEYMTNKEVERTGAPLSGAPSAYLDVSI